jgi:hypothetical protein
MKSRYFNIITLMLFHNLFSAVFLQIFKIQLYLMNLLMRTMRTMIPNMNLSLRSTMMLRPLTSPLPLNLSHAPKMLTILHLHKRSLNNIVKLLQDI